MLKVVAVSDKVHTAIDRLSHGVEKYHDNLDYTVCDVHPKRPDERQLYEFEKAARYADVIDWQYFRTAEMLRKRFDWLKDKKHILTHNNPYSIHESKWNNYDLNIGNNKSIYSDLKKITQTRVDYIPLAVSHEFWQFQRDYEPKKQVIMVANRIESKKGVLETAIACSELGIKLVLVGAISDMAYFQAVMATNTVQFYEQISDEQLRELYYESMLHVCNSADNFESGTLPILESMLTGVPVLTRKVGHVPDFYNEENLLIIDHDKDDVEKLTTDIYNAISDTKSLKNMREKAWNSIKHYNYERRAFAYQKIYRSVMFDDTESVSIIMPIINVGRDTLESLNGAVTQDYKNIEIIVVDDNKSETMRTENRRKIMDVGKTVSVPLRYIDNGKDDYGLARARNRGVIEATGDVLIFCDQRIKMDKNAVTTFMSELQKKTWLYGVKNGVKKDFVENFSCIRKDDFVTFGMFNERIDCYGGLSEETRVRARNQGITIRRIENAKAEALGRSKNKYTKKPDIIRAKNMLFKMGVQ